LKVRGHPRPALPVLLPALLAWLLLAVAPVAASPVTLSSPAVTPTAGTTDTLVTLAVTYRNAKGDLPDTAQVTVGSTIRSLTPIGGSPKQGLRYAVALRLPAGSHAIVFAAVLFTTLTAVPGYLRSGREDWPRATLDGTAYLESKAPGDRGAFEWINANVRGIPGDDEGEFPAGSMPDVASRPPSGAADPQQLTIL